MTAPLRKVVQPIQCCFFSHHLTVYQSCLCKFMRYFDSIPASKTLFFSILKLSQTLEHDGSSKCPRSRKKICRWKNQSLLKAAVMARTLQVAFPVVVLQRHPNGLIWAARLALLICSSWQTFQKLNQSKSWDKSLEDHWGSPVMCNSSRRGKKTPNVLIICCHCTSWCFEGPTPFFCGQSHLGDVNLGS